MIAGGRGHLPFTRRNFFKTAIGAASLMSLPKISLAANPTGNKLHGLSSFGDLKYSPGFSHFDFAEPEASNGGKFAFQPSYWYFNQNTQTFNTLNSFILKGEAPPRMELCFDTLMVWAWDEPDAMYCSTARTVEISEDRNIYRFELREDARFHDGSELTAEDVAFSYLLLKEKGHPQIAIDLVNLTKAYVVSKHVVELIFNGKQSDRAILSAANVVPILSKQFYEKLSFDDHVMEPPLGSGPWKVGKFSPGLFIEYDRNDDYWAKELPFARGLDHFDTLRIDFFAERQPAFEAFKKGEVRWREEFTSKIWATEYNFPAVQSGKVVQKLFSDEKDAALQGWAINTRRDKFGDGRVRQAIGLAFDFEWTNKNIFYGAYSRSHSTFEGSDFVPSGLPDDKELQLLEPFKDQLPKSVFGEPIRQFVNDGSGNNRKALRLASRLLKDAGYKRDSGRLLDEGGTQFTMEFLIRSQVFERLLGPYINNLKTLGIEASIRLVDASQYQARVEAFDFDITGLSMRIGATPSAESLENFLHSSTANRYGSRNYAGIKNPTVDHLVDAVKAASSREEMKIVLKAIDRVLRSYHYWIPNWHSANHRVAMWDEFGWKEPKPDYFFPVERIWWQDPTKIARLRDG